MQYLSVSFWGLLWAHGALGVNNGLAITPPMGWNNWNSLACDVSEDLLLSTSQKLVDLGLQDLGYNYVVLDDCWQGVRGEDGYMRVNEKKFPNGMKAIADHLHGLGLKFGMYSSAGEMTCARFGGSLDYETQDAENFAAWEVDFVKYDNCFHLGRMGTPKLSFDRFKKMADALNVTGRPMVFNLCNWGEDYVHTWGMSIANSWRMSGDIYDSFTRPDDLCACNTNNPNDPFCIAPGSHCSILFIINKVAPFADRAIPGGWNDLDMLEVGQGGMTDEEYKAHFALWAALKSPLILGNDLRIMDASALTIINNPAIIALSQDPHGRSVTRVQRNLMVPKDQYGVGETHVWSGMLENDDQAVIYLNAASEDLEMSCPLSEIFVSSGPGGSAPQVRSAWDIYDLWANRMPIEEAEAILKTKNQTARNEIFKKLNWYNATEIPYSIGLENGDTRLFGEKIGTVKAKGTLTIKVSAHSARVFRLRRVSNEGKPSVETRKDEL